MARNDREILAAWAVSSWRTALDHLEALASVGFEADHEVAVVRQELRKFAATFMHLIGEDDGYTEDQLAVAVRKARQLATAHQSRIDVLLRERE